ncbi:MAG: DUF3365 domain-containing protein [Proteobacteria bacterium]|nr:DUF3365 domain-containing protein [Pseudomonadota bacterium]MBU0966644.1 DUF3365 domain-containing protein [Pseudomonadota bacterium]
MSLKNSNKPGISIGWCLNIGLGVIFTLVAFFLVYNVRISMREQAMFEAADKAKLILDRNLSIHRYFSDNLKPEVFELTETCRPQDYFEPSWMSSTFAVRKIDKYSQELSGEKYYYKECAINARSPHNEADEIEKSFLLELNNNPQLNIRSFVREIDGENFYVTMRRGEAMEESCMRCHNTPEQAPQGLVQAYGHERSFGRNVGEIVSAISIRVPLSSAFANADRFSQGLSLILLVFLIGLFIAQFFIYRLFVGKPLGRLRDKALQINNSDEHLGEEIPLPYARELNILAQSFNKMSIKLRRNMDNLEHQVQERTSELMESNQQLHNEIHERVQAEKEKEKLIEQLHQALAEIKTLHGIIPICSFCKKIRDDKGYWSQVEAYVQKHTQAEFSHAVCPVCLKEHYPELMDD